MTCLHRERPASGADSAVRRMTCHRPLQASEKASGSDTLPRLWRESSMKAAGNGRQFHQRSLTKRNARRANASATNTPLASSRLKGPFMGNHRAEVLAFARNLEEAEKNEHPLNRIMTIEEPGGRACHQNDGHPPAATHRRGNASRLPWRVACALRRGKLLRSCRVVARCLGSRFQGEADLRARSTYSWRSGQIHCALGPTGSGLGSRCRHNERKIACRKCAKQNFHPLWQDKNIPMLQIGLEPDHSAGLSDQAHQRFLPGQSGSASGSGQRTPPDPRDLDGPYRNRSAGLSIQWEKSQNGTPLLAHAGTPLRCKLQSVGIRTDSRAAAPIDDGFDLP